MRCWREWAMIMVLLLPGCAITGTQPIPVYVYYEFPPFEIARQTDLSEMLVERLNRDTDYRWQLIFISKARMTRSRLPGVILWSNPKWHENAPDLLVSEPILWDADVLLFNRQKPLTGEFPAAVVNRLFCAVSSHRYLSLEKLQASGSIRAVERETQNECAQLLLAQKVDFIQMEKSHLFTEYQQSLGSTLEYLEPPLDNFQRFALMDKSLAAEFQQLNRVVKNLQNDPAWRKELERLGGSRFVDLFDLNIDDLMRYDIKPSQ